MRDLIKLIEGQTTENTDEVKTNILKEFSNKNKKKITEMAKRVSPEEFVDLVKKSGKGTQNLTLAGLQDIARQYDTQIPTSIRHGDTYKVSKSEWNFGTPEEIYKSDKPQLAADLGGHIDDDLRDIPKSDSDYVPAINLAHAKTKQLLNLAAKNKIQIMGKRPKGSVDANGKSNSGHFFKIPGSEIVLAQLERLLAKQLEDPNGSDEMSMEEQYEDLEEKVRLVAEGKSTFMKSILITGAPSSGKGADVNTPIPTPSGWTTMGDIKVGDTLYDENGNHCTVVETSPIHNLPCYEITFDDGTKIVTDNVHRWLTSTNSSRSSESRNKKRWTEGRELKPRGTDQSHKRTTPSVVNTEEISKTLKVHGKYNHQVANSKAILGEDSNDMIISPWLLGAWLGDGSSSTPTITCGEQDIEQFSKILDVDQENYKIIKNKNRTTSTIILSSGNDIKKEDKFIIKMRKLNLYKNKHIPKEYLRASYETRLSLLQGLMDTDGHIDKLGKMEFCSVIPQLAEDVYELICSLGIKATMRVSESKLYGVKKKDRYRIYFATTEPVFRFERKLEKIKKTIKHCNVRTIVSCNPVDSVPTKCISVDSPNSLFLITKSFIPTHNTYNVMRVIKELGLKEGPDYIKKTGSISVPSMYRTLLQKINGLVIFDDCDNVVHEDSGINILKGALDTTPVREISLDNKRMVDVDGFSMEKRNEYGMRLSRILNDEPFTEQDYEFFMPIAKRYGVKWKVPKNESLLIDPKLKKLNEAPNDDDDDEDDDEAQIDAFGRPIKPKKPSSSFDDETMEDDMFPGQSEIITFITNRLPNKFDFQGRVIFISNLDQDEWDSAILTRAFTIQMNFKSSEMLDFIDKIKSNIKCGITEDEKQEVMDYLRELYLIGKVKKPINFRLVQSAFDMRLTPNWKRMIANNV
jgi:hypothetical protein